MSGSNLFKKIAVLFVSLITLTLVFQNCSDVGFRNTGELGSANSNGNSGSGPDGSDPLDGGEGLPPACQEITASEEQVYGECLFLFDTFDRETILGQNSDPNNPFSWQTIIDDRNREDYADINATIYERGEFGLGPARHEEHAVYVTGRTGSSVHDVYFISIPLDMTDYNRMRIDFSYLPIDLERWNWNNDKGLEHVRLEVCTDSLSECGIEAGGGFDTDGLNGDSWEPVYLQPGFAANNDNNNGFLSAIESGQNNTGRNHTNKTWLEGSSGYINLNNVSNIRDKSQVVFRIAIVLDNGFEDNNDPSSDIDDAIAIDFVRVIASKQSAN